MDYKDYISKNESLRHEVGQVSDLSHLIAEARSYAGITQAELARRMGTKQPSIARAESGDQEPSVSFLEKVAEAVGSYLVYPKFGFMVEKEAASSMNAESVYLSLSAPSRKADSSLRNYSFRGVGVLNTVYRNSRSTVEA